MVGLIEIAKMVLQLAVIIFFLGAIGIWSLFFADLDPPLNEPPCKRVSVVSFLDPCRTIP